MNMQNGITSREKFLDKKRDYSPFLVHLTREGIDRTGNIVMPAEEVLHCILNEKSLNAYNYYCLFKDKIDLLENTIKNKFKVACFTETPIDQIEVLLEKVQGRNMVLSPYGLIFKKDYISKNGGNQVFYITEELSRPLWTIYDKAVDSNFPDTFCRLLALINRCDDKIDFHWEREWRVVGNLKFDYEDIYCGICPESEIQCFESNYSVTFIDPHWGINKILDKMINKLSSTPPELPF
jgi:hypothetical protein